jgi:excinuclease ABC subunit A
VIPNLERRWKETDSAWVREEIERYMSNAPCPACDGYRLKPEARAVKINGCTSARLPNCRSAWPGTGSMSCRRSSMKQNEIAVRILKEIRDRLKLPQRCRPDYLTLSRNSGTLSGGESQRIRLASQIGSGLTGVLYVLDEPSIGLHQRDNARLLETLKHLRDLGNTVIVVEHDEDAILTADYVVDIGPMPASMAARSSPRARRATSWPIRARSPASISPANSRSRCRPAPQIAAKKEGELKVVGARGNNLKNVVDASVPLGVFTAVTGVSGGGKSTFLIETLYKAAARRVMARARTRRPRPDRRLEHIDKVIDIDQSPIGRTPRSNPATYTGAFTPIRDWFAGLPEAKARGYQPGRFSFNVKGGRCEACQGDGVIKIEMHFLPDVYVTCDVCHGKRYNRETLDVTFKGKSIADVLDMTVEEGVEFFAAVPAVRDKLQALQGVGLGYIKVGQQATTLSGGEAQRVKLAKELSKRSTGRTLYILDEPTTGLHFHDVAKLLEVLHELVDQGNTVVVIEHNLEVIKTADWVIDSGPKAATAAARSSPKARPRTSSRSNAATPASSSPNHSPQFVDVHQWRQ